LREGATLNKGIESNVQRVEVLDLLSGNTSIYLSLNEAAKATGCHVTTISKALKKIGEGGCTNIIKKRYRFSKV